jgi:chorismate-pyruvate lyase
VINTAQAVAGVALAVGAALLASSIGGADTLDSPARPRVPDTFLTRVEVLALLQTLNAELLSHDSATLTLERWCDDHHLASPARMTASRVTGVDKPASADLRRELGVTATEVIKYRRVTLLCGTVPLSSADNWYVPSRLTPEMNRSLDSSDTPFGKVIQPLHFRRQTLAASLLWSPLPPGWELQEMSNHGGDLELPPELIQHRALLTLPDGTPVSEVVETYSSKVLAFPLPIPADSGAP